MVAPIDPFKLKRNIKAPILFCSAFLGVKARTWTFCKTHFGMLCWTAHGRIEQRVSIPS